MILMAAAALLAKNVNQVLKSSVTDAQVSSTARYLVPIIALGCLLYVQWPQYTCNPAMNGVQPCYTVIPGLSVQFDENNFVNKQGAIAGIAAGVAAVSYVTITGSTAGTIFPFLPQAIQDFNVGYHRLDHQ
ncbi:hypothetical protein CUU66_13525 [Peribacillus deserti]|uniref:Uncharacterized protein n=1 Tax=Peribacillus deserti TaxID=673318 RepID=A0A2N5M4P5_9BACI|nr:hypothetical protein CUU66_13525 [Peribacillus deserti]